MPSHDQSRIQQVERHIADRRELIIVQKRRIAELKANGHNAAGSIALLRELEASLRSILDAHGVVVRKLRRRGSA
jgi:hypothetical protein